MTSLLARLLALAALTIFCVPSYAGDCTSQSSTPCGALQDNAIYQNNLQLGVNANGSFPGSVSLANGNASGQYVNIQNLSTTSAWNFNLPATAGPSAFLLTSAGGASSSMSWTSPTVQINGVNCTLGSTCAITASAGTITVGTTTIASGTNGAILYNNAGVLGNIAQVPLSAGGTNANLTASLGGVFYSTGSAGAILSGTATANQMLQSGASAAPTWSTSTWPATTTANDILYSSSANTVGQITTAANSVLATNGGSVPSLVTTLPSSLTAPSLTVTTAFTATGLDVLTNLATQATNTIVGNATSGSASPTALAIGSCSTSASALLWTTNTGFSCNTAIAAASMAASGITGQVALANGGTNANLTASNGGIFYSTASAGAILNGTATANQMLMSGSSTSPTWSAATWPNTVTQGQMLYSSGSNTWSASSAPTLGLNGSISGALNLATSVGGGAAISILNGGATSGYNFNLPVTAGTSSYLLTSTGGGASAMSWTSPTVTINTVPCTVGSTCTISASGSLVVGSSSVTSGSNGFILYDNAGTLGNLPVTGSAGNVVLSSAPSLSSASIAGLTVTSSFTASGLVTNSSLANMTADTVKCNATSGSSAPTDCTTLPPTMYVAGTLPKGRLTLTTGTPVMVATANAQTTLYYDCYHGANVVPYYTGSIDALDTIGSCEVSDVMVSAASIGQVVSGQVYDVWWVHSGANRICLAMTTSAGGGGGGWAQDTGGSNTARGTGFTKLDTTTRPYITNANSLSNCYNGSTNYGSVGVNQATYLGTIYAVANGEITYAFGAAASGGTPGLFGVWNNYNRVKACANATDSHTSYTYTSATVRQADNSAGNQVQFVSGLAEDGISASLASSGATVATSNAFVVYGFGLDSTTVFSPGAFAFIKAPTAASQGGSMVESYNYPSLLGLHTISLNEASDGLNANTFNFGANQVTSVCVFN